MTSKEPRSRGRLAEKILALEKEILIKAMRKFSGNTTLIGEYLGISRRSTYDKIRYHGLEERTYKLRARDKISGPRGSRKAPDAG